MKLPFNVYAAVKAARGFQTGLFSSKEGQTWLEARYTGYGTGEWSIFRMRLGEKGRGRFGISGSQENSGLSFEDAVSVLEAFEITQRAEGLNPMQDGDQGFFYPHVSDMRPVLENMKKVKSFKEGVRAIGNKIGFDF